MSRKNFWSWLPLALFALIMLPGLCPVVLGGMQRGLLATGLWKAEVPAIPATQMPVLLTGDATYPHDRPLVTLDGKACMCQQHKPAQKLQRFALYLLAGRLVTMSQLYL